MEYVVNIIAAPVDEAQAVADSECPLDEWRGIDAPGVTPAMLAQIESTLTGAALSESLDKLPADIVLDKSQMFIAVRSARKTVPNDFAIFDRDHTPINSAKTLLHSSGMVTKSPWPAPANTSKRACGSSRRKRSMTAKGQI